MYFKTSLMLSILLIGSAANVLGTDSKSINLLTTSTSKTSDIIIDPSLALNSPKEIHSNKPFSKSHVENKKIIQQAENSRIVDISKSDRNYVETVPITKSRLRNAVPQEATASSSSAAASKAQSEVAFVDVVSSTNSGKDPSLSILSDKNSPSFVEVVSTDKKVIINNNVRRKLSRILKDSNKPTRSPSHESKSNSMKASSSKSESEDKANDEESDGDGNNQSEDKEENEKSKEEAASDVVGKISLIILQSFLIIITKNTILITFIRGEIYHS